MALAVACLALAGCGTTVPLAARGAQGTGLGSAGQTATSAGADTASGASAPTGTPGPGGTAAAAGGVGGVSSAQGPSAATGSVPDTVATGAAVSHAPIRVGVAAVNYAAFAAAFGVSAAGDPYTAYRNIFAKLNARGGLAGHPIQPYYETLDASAANAANEADRACTALTADDKVAVVLAAVVNEEFTSCLQKAGVAQLDITQFGYDTPGMRQHPNLLLPDALDVDRYMSSLLTTAVSLGKLKAGQVLGVLHEDCPVEDRTYAGTVVPLAKQLGVKLVEASVNCYGGFNDLGTVSSQIQGAVLKFASSGVTTVTCMSASEGFCLVVFTKAASNQQYKPNYLITSNAFPYADSDTSQPVSYAADQIPGMTGIGWASHIDLGPQARPDSRQKAAQAACTALDPTFGGHIGDSGTVRENYINFFYMSCDDIMVLKAIVALVGVHLPYATAVAAYGQVAADVASASSPTGRLATNGRHDGAQAVQPFAWSAAGTCFMPIGSVVAAR